MKLKLPKVLIFSFCALLLFIYGCSTTNHATLPAQANADITSHYNAWFNTNEKIQSILSVSYDTHKDKFDSVIPVYYYSSPKEFAANSSDLDDVIKRSTLAIQIHPIANWTDDHFLIIGEANYLKGDYDKAANSFKYITTQFKNGVDYVKVMKSLHKKVGKYVVGKNQNVKPVVKTIVNPDGTKTLQKVDNRPEKNIMIHTPARSEALVWLIKTYTRQGKFDQALSIVTYVRSDNNFYKNYDDDLNLAEADIRVSKKDYAGAITPLEKYLESEKVKKRKKLSCRPQFVLAQCYQMIGNNAKAIENYKLVLKSRPNYDMEFYAKLKMAKLGRGNSSNNAEIRALLSKMAKQPKYRDYWDQVYYELALISLSENNRTEARTFLHSSIKFSKSNDQKGISFLKLAELDYEDEAYVPSKFFYDSTLSFMAKNDKGYRAVEERDKVLDNLVKQLTIIHDEDSLQKLASMSREEIDKVIKATIARKEKEEEDRKAAAELAKFQNLQTAANSSGTGQNSGGASWYFYNTGTRAQGYNDFVKKWGNRNLEEDWRRANKNTSSSSDEETAVVDTAGAKKDSTAAPKGSPEEKMYAAIPTTPEKLAKSTDKLIDAYYNAGTIYKDGLESYPKAQDMFETLNSRFPKHKLQLESYYNLYLIALKLKKPDMAEKYKALILENYPESVIAKVLKDPSYVNQAKQKEKVADDYFESAYNDYAQNRLDSAWYKAEMSNTLFKPNTLSAKFQLLQALILSKQNRLGDYVQALNNIINKGSDTQIKKSASDLLSLLNKSKLPQIDLSMDTTRRDSLNKVYGAMQVTQSINAARPDTAEQTLLQKLEAAKQAAIKSGLLKPDTAGKATVSTVTAGKDTTANKAGAVNPGNTTTADVVTEDTTSIYKRSDDAVHLFVIYIKDPATPKSAIMSTLAKINAYNSTQFADKRLQAKQSLLDAKNQLIAVRQFKSKADVMTYFNSIATQSQLFNDMKPEQYAITAISMPNYSILISEKDVDTYNKFFNRVYKK